METQVLEDYRGLLVTIILMLVWISGATTANYDYSYRCFIPKWMNIFFGRKAKNGTVPLLSLVATIELYATVPILLAIKNFEPKVDLDVLTSYSLLIPWLMIVTPSIVVMEGLAKFKKKKRIKEEKEERIKMKRDNWIANNVKKKKK